MNRVNFYEENKTFAKDCVAFHYGPNIILAPISPKKQLHFADNELFSQIETILYLLRSAIQFEKKCIEADQFKIDFRQIIFFKILLVFDLG